MRRRDENYFLIFFLTRHFECVILIPELQQAKIVHKVEDFVAC